LYTAGETLANNPVTALMWKTLTVMEEVTGGIEIPFVNVYGFGLDLNMSVESLLKTGMFGLSALSNVGNMVSSIASGGGLDLDSWGFKEYTSRGGEFQSTVGGVQSTKSGSKTLTSASSSDSKKQALSSTEEDQEEQKKSSKESMKDEITLETLYKEIFEKKTPIYVIDSPLNSKTETIVTAVSNVSNKVSQLYDLLSSSSSMGIRAYVTNIDKTPTTTVPSSFTISKINDKNFTQELAKQIAQGVLGSSDDTTVDGVATLSDIANILLTGVISVRDDVTSRTLQEINSNLY
jgi:prophage DNA circulation protein